MVGLIRTVLFIVKIGITRSIDRFQFVFIYEGGLHFEAPVFPVGIYLKLGSLIMSFVYLVCWTSYAALVDLRSLLEIFSNAIGHPPFVLCG